MYQSFVITYLFTSISYFPYFKFVTFKTRVVVFNTLKKEGRVSEILANEQAVGV